MRILSLSVVVLSVLPPSTTSFLSPFATFSRVSLHSSKDEPSPEPTTSTSSSIKNVQSIETSQEAEIIARSPTGGQQTSIIQSPYVPPQGEAWKQGFFDVPKLITLDATNTIIQLRSSVGMFYREVLFEATDYNARLPRPELFTAGFKKAFAEMDAKYPSFGCGTGMSSKEWWYDVVKNTYDNVPIEEPGLREEMDEWLFDEVFEALYSDVFVTEEAWELRQGALEALSHFVQWRKEGGPAIAVMSNFDERLHAILKNLDVYDAFDFVLTSREIGAAKPDRRAFEVAMSRLGLTKAEDCMHVGDEFSVDVAGASGAGWHAVYIPANGEQDIPKVGSDNMLFSMVGDLFGVLKMFGREPENRIIVTTRPILEEGNFGFHQKTWTEDIDENVGPRTPYALPDTEKKSWEGPGRF
mmetsp:Transcript_13092/g.16530  ORF Transcript_13092/g.16530 Transcript_13092/m.16530 type:complete len:412 (-) Transcript_13092:207-1442(-)|eukprot:CAMPEP_0172495456 /NCGR_PEP_ID=MMETSP1066-20121228/71206_1 /TAXON_ID=671091 /ORGANISM="Coscinodiscus wailesii, Strain CCMP2513" /LENGTH=411 /DNA_ID=CAMNT_0013267145 /DNA_START=125 /DNA_END=1360 /DNA_ORIENTATION=+